MTGTFKLNFKRRITRFLSTTVTKIIEERIMKLPSFGSIPADWMKDPALRSVSLEARGLWMDMLCLLFESVAQGLPPARDRQPRFKRAGSLA